jgi:hypothetical protein
MAKKEALGKITRYIAPKRKRPGRHAKNKRAQKQTFFPSKGK